MATIGINARLLLGQNPLFSKQFGPRFRPILLECLQANRVGVIEVGPSPLTPNMPFPWETVPPLAIICGATALMGALPHGIQKLFYGKPKAVLQDSWDRQLGKRDERVLQEWQDKQENKVYSKSLPASSLPRLQTYMYQ